MTDDSDSQNPIMKALEQKRQCQQCDELLEDLEGLADEFERQRTGDWRTDQAFERASDRLQELIDEHRGEKSESK